ELPRRPGAGAETVRIASAIQGISGVTSAAAGARSDSRERLTGWSGLRVRVECLLLVRQDLDSFLGCMESLSGTRRSHECRGQSCCHRWAMACFGEGHRRTEGTEESSLSFW